MEHIHTFRDVADYVEACDGCHERRALITSELVGLLRVTTRYMFDLVDCKSLQITRPAEDTFIHGPDIMKQINAMCGFLYRLAEVCARSGLNLPKYETNPDYRKGIASSRPGRIRTLSHSQTREFGELTIVNILKIIENVKAPLHPEQIEEQERELYKMYFQSIRLFHGHTNINLFAFLQEIHAANMRKVVDGKVMKADDGEVLTPKGWVGPEEGMLELLQPLLKAPE